MRECARNSKAFMTLCEIYENRDDHLKELKNKGKKIIGLVGDEIPGELIMAAGYVPVMVCGKLGYPTPITKECIEDYYLCNGELSTMYERLVDGTYFDVLDSVILCNPITWIYRLYISLRELKRQQPGAKVPPLYFYDFEGKKASIDQKRNVAVAKQLRKALEEWSGATIKDEDIQKAIDVFNENRNAISRFDAFRNGPVSRVAGSEALIVIGAGMFMEKEEHTRLVKQVAEEAESWPVIEGKRIYYSGSDLHYPSLYEDIEEAGGNVVGEDHNWGVRYYDRNIEYRSDPINGIIERYMFRMAKGKTTVEERVKALKEGVEQSSAQAVLFYYFDTDAYNYWDYPSQKEMLDEKGIPSQLLGTQMVPPVNVDEIKARIRALV